MAGTGLALVLGSGLALAAGTTPSPWSFAEQSAQSPEMASALRIFLGLTALSFIPAALVCMTCFVRIVVVLSMLRHAIGLMESPPNVVIITLALFLTLFSMQPVLQRLNDDAVQPYLAGQLKWLLELGPMLWPTINSYKRLVDGFWAPVKPTWGIDNRTASFRVIPGGPKSTRLETRCPGADVNPYLGIAACIAAGMAGVEKNLKLTTPPIAGTNVGGEAIARAPRTLIETTRIFRDSAFARDWFGDEFVDHFAATREWEWRRWLDAVTDWERQRYFEII